MSNAEIERALCARGLRFEVLRFARGSRLPLRRVLARIYMGHGILAVRGHWLAGIDPILSALRLSSAQASVQQMRAAGPLARGER
jgi:hypothetical protein